MAPFPLAIEIIIFVCIESLDCLMRLLLVYEYGDDVSRYCEEERVLLMCNHQSTADVPTLMAVLQSKGVASRKVSRLILLCCRRLVNGRKERSI